MALDAAIEASNLLFGKATKEGLEKLDEQTFLDVFDGVPQFEISKDQLGQPAIELFTTVAPVFPSKGEMRKMVQGGGVSLNKEKIADQNRPITAPLQPHLLIIGRWCNGNTTGFGSVIPGSNPSRPTRKKTEQTII